VRIADIHPRETPAAPAGFRSRASDSSVSAAFLAPTSARAPRRRALQAQLSACLPALVRAIGAMHGFVYARTRGRFLARRCGLPILLLETTGRASGLRRRTPVCYLADERGLAVIPANGGSRRAPDWWLNLSASGEAIATVGALRRLVRPVVASGERRERLWRRFLAACPELEPYRASARRKLPVAGSRVHCGSLAADEGASTVFPGPLGCGMR
jgi:deazaflavin-dependent oxidoreductase (nitroreductase family)